MEIKLILLGFSWELFGLKTQVNCVMSYHEIYLHIFSLSKNYSSQRDKYSVKKNWKKLCCAIKRMKDEAKFKFAHKNCKC